MLNWIVVCLRWSGLSSCSISCRDSLLLLFGTLLEENLPKHFLFLLIWVIILNVIIWWLVEGKVVIVVTIRVLVPYLPSSLHHRTLGLSTLGQTYLWGKQKYSFVETANNRDLWLLILLALLSVSLNKPHLTFGLAVFRVRHLPLWRTLIRPLEVSWLQLVLIVVFKTKASQFLVVILDSIILKSHWTIIINHHYVFLNLNLDLLVNRTSYLSLIKWGLNIS